MYQNSLKDVLRVLFFKIQFSTKLRCCWCFNINVLNFLFNLVVPAHTRSIADQSTDTGSRRFVEWMDVMDAMLEDLRRWSVGPDAPLPHSTCQVKWNTIPPSPLYYNQSSFKLCVQIWLITLACTETRMLALIISTRFLGCYKVPFFNIKFLKIHFILLVQPQLFRTVMHFFESKWLKAKVNFQVLGCVGYVSEHTASGALLSSSVSSFPMLTGMRICSFLSSSCPLGCWLQRAQQHVNFFIRNFQNRRNNVTSSSG